MDIRIWRGYFYFMCVVFLGIVFRSSGMPWAHYLDMVSSFFTLVALYGYCYQRAIYQRFFWKGVFGVGIFQEAIQMIVNPTHGDQNFNYWVGYFLSFFLFVGPIYLASYLYAFDRKDIWGD